MTSSSSPLTPDYASMLLASRRVHAAQWQAEKQVLETLNPVVLERLVLFLPKPPPGEKDLRPSIALEIAESVNPHTQECVAVWGLLQLTDARQRRGGSGKWKRARWTIKPGKPTTPGNLLMELGYLGKFLRFLQTRPCLIGLPGDSLDAALNVTGLPPSPEEVQEFLRFMGKTTRPTAIPETMHHIADIAPLEDKQVYYLNCTLHRFYADLWGDEAAATLVPWRKWQQQAPSGTHRWLITETERRPALNIKSTIFQAAYSFVEAGVDSANFLGLRAPECRFSVDGHLAFWTKEGWLPFFGDPERIESRKAELLEHQHPSGWMFPSPLCDKPSSPRFGQHMNQEELQQLFNDLGLTFASTKLQFYGAARQLVLGVNEDLVARGSGHAKSMLVDLRFEAAEAAGQDSTLFPTAHELASTSGKIERCKSCKTVQQRAAVRKCSMCGKAQFEGVDELTRLLMQAFGLQQSYCDAVQRFPRDDAKRLLDLLKNKDGQ